ERPHVFEDVILESAFECDKDACGRVGFPANALPSAVRKDSNSPSPAHQLGSLANLLGSLHAQGDGLERRPGPRVVLRRAFLLSDKVVALWTRVALHHLKFSDVELDLGWWAARLGRRGLGDDAPLTVSHPDAEHHPPKPHRPGLHAQYLKAALGTES